jgi:AmpD protein
MSVAERMKIDMETGLLNAATYKPSPHYDERPQDMAIDLLVIHNISLPPGEFGIANIEAFFCGQLDISRHPYFSEIGHLRVSSHLLISRKGDIVQFVPFHKRAWHAGQSTFSDRSNCNDFSIGIELEGTDTLPYEAVQYDQLVKIIDAIRATYPAITIPHIVGHSDIAPGRKTDPGMAFDWINLKGKLV